MNTAAPPAGAAGSAIKRKFEFEFAHALAQKLVAALDPHVVRILICGSLRRRKPQVGDIEIVYIPKIATEQNPESLFPDPLQINLTDRAIDDLINRGTLAKRENVLGRTAWGSENKLAVLVKTGVPVDLFAATERNWFNYIVCRTGSAETNTRIATLAQARGIKWHPYGHGFTSLDGLETYPVTTEADVFHHVGLPYLEPHER